MPIESGEKKFLPGKLERPPILDRIVSDKISIERKIEFRDILLSRFTKQEFADILEKEIGHSPEQDSLIREANRLTDEILSRLGIGSQTHLEPKHVHILDGKDFLDLSREEIDEHTRAVASPAFQAICIKNREMTAIEFLSTIVHEMLHLKSFVSFQLFDNIGDSQDRQGFSAVARRAGLKIRKFPKTKSGKTDKNEGKNVLFDELDEAIMERLALDIIRNSHYDLPDESRKSFEDSEKFRKILVDYINNSFEKRKNQMKLEEIEELEHLLVFFEWGVMILPRANNFLKMYESNNQSELVLEQAISFYFRGKVFSSIPMFSYIDQRVKMEKLIAEIFNRNLDKFKSPMNVFKLFIKASIEGQLLPLARIIEQTFGKGSFRKLGEGIDITK